MPDFEITWEAPEFEHRPKDVSWYWASIILTMVILAFAIWQRNFLFGFFIVIAEILVLVWGAREPQTIRFHLTDKELTIHETKRYPLSDIEHFSFEEALPGSEWADIVIRFRRHPRPPLRIYLPKEKSEPIVKAFRILLPEVEREETFMDTIEKLLRF